MGLRKESDPVRQVVLDDLLITSGGELRLRRRRGAAERADEQFLRRVPARFAAACASAEQRLSLSPAFCGGMTLIELAPGVTIDEVKQKTEASFKIDAKLKH